MGPGNGGAAPDADNSSPAGARGSGPDPTSGKDAAPGKDAGPGEDAAPAAAVLSAGPGGLFAAQALPVALRDRCVSWLRLGGSRGFAGILPAFDDLAGSTRDRATVDLLCTDLLHRTR